MKVLIDTGASVSFIDEALAATLHPPPKRNESTLAVILGNSTEEATTKNIEVDIMLKNHKFPCAVTECCWNMPVCVSGFRVNKLF